MEQSFNRVIQLKQFVLSVRPVYEALAGARSELLLQIQRVRVCNSNLWKILTSLQNCSPEMIDPVIDIVNEVLNDDAQYAKSPLELRNQRTYAVKVLLRSILDMLSCSDHDIQCGVNGFLDVARQTFKETSQDAYILIQTLAGMCLISRPEILVLMPLFSATPTQSGVKVRSCSALLH
jgi:DNA mismatch repair protein MSH4